MSVVSILRRWAEVSPRSRWLGCGWMTKGTPVAWHLDGGRERGRCRAARRRTPARKSDATKLGADAGHRPSAVSRPRAAAIRCSHRGRGPAAKIVFGVPPLSTRPWTSQVVSAGSPRKVGSFGVELITAVPLPPADPHSNPPPSSRIPIGQVTVASLVWPGATATPSPSTAVASPRLARKDRGGRDVRAADRSGREVLVED
jgi:hypothetical protein